MDTMLWKQAHSVAMNHFAHSLCSLLPHLLTQLLLLLLMLSCTAVRVAVL